MVAHSRFRRFAMFALLMVSGCGKDAEPPLKYPRFETAPARIERVKIGDKSGWRLKEGFLFHDPAKKCWVAPAGTQTDGASIPGWALSAVGCRFEDSFVDAAVVHDAYCSELNKDGQSFHKEVWQDVHAMFYEALIASGTPKLKASLMYAAVYLGGPRWDLPGSESVTSLKAFAEIPSDLRAAQLAECKRWIESEFAGNKALSKEDITQWMEASEEPLLRGEIRSWRAE